MLAHLKSSPCFRLQVFLVFFLGGEGVFNQKSPPCSRLQVLFFLFSFFLGGGWGLQKKFTLFQAASCTRWKPGLSWSSLFGDSHTQHCNWGWWFISIFILKYFWFVYFSPRIQLCCELLIQSPVVTGHAAYWHLFISSFIFHQTL